MLFCIFQSEHEYIPMTSLQSCFYIIAMSLPFFENEQPFDELNFGERMKLVVFYTKLYIEHL